MGAQNQKKVLYIKSIILITVLLYIIILVNSCGLHIDVPEPKTSYGKHGRFIVDEYSLDNYFIAEDRHEIYYIRCNDGCAYNYQIYALNYKTGESNPIYTDLDEDAYLKLVKYERKSNRLFFSDNRLLNPKLKYINLSEGESFEYSTYFELLENGYLIKDDLLILKTDPHPFYTLYFSIYKSDLEGKLELLNIKGDPIYIYENNPEIIVRDSTGYIYTIFNYELNLAVDSIITEDYYSNGFFEMDGELYYLYESRFDSRVEIKNIRSEISFFNLSIKNPLVLDINTNTQKLVLAKGQYQQAGAHYIDDTVHLKMFDLITYDEKELSKVTREFFIGAVFLNDEDSLIYNTRQGFYMVGM